MAERKKAKHAPEAETPRPVAKTVGEVLRATRLAKGYEYEDVSAAIHIRPGQLKAIEENDIESLPGMTYAIGFVRSYANFLGLNGAEVVHHFKVEQGHDAGPSKLAFPEPVVESRTPDIMMVGVGGFLAIAMLIGWAVYSNLHSSSKVADQIPPAPAEVTSIVQTPATPVATSAAMPGPDAGLTPLTATPAVTPAAANAAAPGMATAPAASAPSSTTPASPSPVAPAASAASQVSPAAAPAPLSEKMVPEKAAAEKATVAVDGGGASTVTDKKADKKKTADKEADDKKAGDKSADVKPADDDVINIKKGKSRITLKAVQDGWVQVMDEHENVLYKKVLRKGEQYSVPDQPGLSLDTANAGGLSVSVDGKVVAPLGNPGDIERGIVLDPATLKARRPRAGTRSSFQE